MKSFNFVKSLSLAGICLAALILPAAVFAQAPGGQAAGGMNPSMTRFFGTNTNFVAKAEVHVLDKSGQETTSMSMGFEMLGSKIRVDINMAEVKSKEMSPEFAATMKQIGMDQMTTIELPEDKSIITVYPGLKSFTKSPMPKNEVDGAFKTYKTTSKHLAKETVDGHSCEKDEMTFVDDKGAQEHVVLWHATDLKGFPVQLQMTVDDSVMTMKFKDVKLGRPENSHFEAPGTMTSYEDLNTLMKDAVAKRMPPPTPK